MTRAQYYYGHLRERRKGVLTRARIAYIFQELRNLRFFLAWQAISDGFCLIKDMSEDEYATSSFAFFKHQKIHKRFKQRYGKYLFVLVRTSDV